MDSCTAWARRKHDKKWREEYLINLGDDEWRQSSHVTPMQTNRNTILFHCRRDCPTYNKLIRVHPSQSYSPVVDGAEMTQYAQSSSNNPPKNKHITWKNICVFCYLSCYTCCSNHIVQHSDSTITRRIVTIKHQLTQSNSILAWYILLQIRL